MRYNVVLTAMGETGRPTSLCCS